ALLHLEEQCPFFTGAARVHPMQAPQQYFTQCLLFSEGKPFCYFIPSVSYPFLIHFIFVSYFQLQGDWMRFERGLLNSQKLHAELHRKMRCVLQQVLLIF
ncbi:hypothetical protein, partial [Intestinimonas butyriciproducens]|uniref:hypothetical protein n=1 Tax=Intestinimonas butyriciproducens TaxID=1297617 RepID=UPI0034A0EF31